MSQQWGRKETVIWPPQVPIYTYGTLLLAIPIMLMLLSSMYLMKPFLARNYTGTFIESTAGAALNLHNNFRLLYLGGGKRMPRVAEPGDFVPGEMTLPGGKQISIGLSPLAKAQGYSFVFRGPARKFADETVRLWLQSDIFGGEELLGSYGAGLIEGGIIVIFMLCFSVRWDYRRGKQMKYGRLLRGPVMQTPQEFNKTLRGAGLGLVTDKKGATIRLPWRAEPKHMWIMGDTGTGKSTLLKQILEQIEDRGDSAIIYDPAAEFVQHFHSEKRGDFVLNPFDARCPYWTPSSELRNPAEARTIAESLYQPTGSKKGEFFTETPQKVFAHLLKYRPSASQLVEWMSSPDEIDARVAKTEIAAMIAKDAPDQRSGVLGSLGLIADSLRLLKAKEKPDEREWSATQWVEKREGWIFLTGTEEAHQNPLRPLQSLWIDLLILRLLAEPKKGQKRVWFILDELATLQRLPKFHDALTKGRKSNNPIIFGFQGKAQVEEIYGTLAKVMLSMPTTKVIMKTSEPEAALWAAQTIGDVEIERVRETKADGKRAGKSFTLDRQIEPLVMPSEIEGLEDLHAFMKLGNYVTRFSFHPSTRERIAPAIVDRNIPEEEMWLKTLPEKPKVPASGGSQAALAPAAVASAQGASAPGPQLVSTPPKEKDNAAAPPATTADSKPVAAPAVQIPLLHVEPTGQITGHI